MNCKNLKNLLLVAGVFTLLIPAAIVLAGDKEDDQDTKTKHFVLGDHHENITINTEDGEMTITMNDGDKSRVTVVDMDQIGFMMEDAFSGVAEVLSSLQMEFRAGQDNNFTLAIEGEEWEVDVDAIMAEVSDALDGAFDDLDTDDWGHHRHYRTIDRHDVDHDMEEMHEELQDELADLQQELKQLKKELRKLKKLEKDSN